MHPTKFRFIWQSGFGGEDFLEIIQSETKIFYSEAAWPNGLKHGRSSMGIAHSVLIR
jgi:RNA-splicing ligase RtcB